MSDTTTELACPECGGTSIDKRGQRRCYATLVDGEIDGWEEGDDIDWDTWESGRDILYCNECDAEFGDDELGATA